MQNVRANVKVLKFQSFCIFSCILRLLIILKKPLTTKAYDRRASGDCGTSGKMVYLSNFISLIFVSLKSSIEDLKVLRELTFWNIDASCVHYKIVMLTDMSLNNVNPMHS